MADHYIFIFNRVYRTAIVNFVTLGSKHHKYIKISFENYLHFSSTFQGQSGMSHGKAAIKV